MVSRINHKYFIFICGLFNDAVINSRIITSNSTSINKINKIKFAEALFRLTAIYKGSMQMINHKIFLMNSTARFVHSIHIIYKYLMTQ
jgi:hypothetical protein